MTHMRIATKLSKTSRHKAQRMAAIVVRGGSVVSAEVNIDRKHAEARAIRPHQNLIGCDIYVARSNGRVSKPCPACQVLIKEAGIRRMIYIGWDGSIVKEAA